MTRGIDMSSVEQHQPVVWTLAGTDPSGGAGIQGDLKTMHGLGVYGCSVITAVIAQNTVGVVRVDPVSPAMIREQLGALESDVPPAAIKIGMVGTAETAKAIADCLPRVTACTVYDPVMMSSSGHHLLDDDGVRAIISALLPRVTLLTPNVPEAERLTGLRISSLDDVRTAATALLALGPKSVLLKGGHVNGPACCDFWTDGRRHLWIASPRQDVTHTHGTGCTLSSAVASCIALGLPETDAVVIGKAYVNQGLRLGGGIGNGRGPLAHLGWPADPRDFPWIVADASSCEPAPASPACGPDPLGFYPIVARAADLEWMLPLGVGTVQLRIKGMDGTALDREVADAVRIAQRHATRLFINDHWREALKHRAYGVHLGQDDIAGADLAEIRAAGLRLGTSAYSYEQLARAMAFSPSYVGVGAVYPTTSKDVSTPSLGLEKLGRMCRLSRVPVAAIGGITLERAKDILAAGANGLAVISDVTAAKDPAGRVRQWIEFMRRYREAQKVLDQG